jgi:hypothetical protein
MLAASAVFVPSGIARATCSANTIADTCASWSNSTNGQIGFAASATGSGTGTTGLKGEAVSGVGVTGQGMTGVAGQGTTGALVTTDQLLTTGTGYGVYADGTGSYGVGYGVYAVAGLTVPMGSTAGQLPLRACSAASEALPGMAALKT